MNIVRTISLHTSILNTAEKYAFVKEREFQIVFLIYKNEGFLQNNLQKTFVFVMLRFQNEKDFSKTGDSKITLVQSTHLVFKDIVSYTRKRR